MRLFAGGRLREACERWLQAKAVSRPAAGLATAVQNIIGAGGQVGYSVMEGIATPQGARCAGRQGRGANPVHLGRAGGYGYDQERPVLYQRKPVGGMRDPDSGNCAVAVCQGRKTAPFLAQLAQFWADGRNRNYLLNISTIMTYDIKCVLAVGGTVIALDGSAI